MKAFMFRLYSMMEGVRQVLGRSLLALSLIHILLGHICLVKAEVLAGDLLDAVQHHRRCIIIVICHNNVCLLYTSLVKLAPMGDPMELRIHGYELTLRLDDAAPVSYTHLDVYKRQA